MATKASEEITAALTAFHEKLDSQQVLKPLPEKPIPLTTVDDSSRNHFLHLVNNWLLDLNIPTKPWSDVFFNIFLAMYEKSTNSTVNEKNNTIWIQTLGNNSPMESKFLYNVFHGDQISNGN